MKGAEAGSNIFDNKLRFRWNRASRSLGAAKARSRVLRMLLSH